METTPIYRGRFAPSPTGPLHFGSLVAAVGSYLQARSRNGEWLVRIEDLDPPREIRGAAADILQTLEHFGFEWNGEIAYQSGRSDIYNAALDQLLSQRMIYPCNCSRQQIKQEAGNGPYGLIYRGRCRGKQQVGTTPTAWRVLTHDNPITFVDCILGLYSQRLESEVGDFVVRRADRLFAYQLAVVVDDAAQRITQVVRGADLLDNTPRQIHLQTLLGYPVPEYAHLPVATNPAGQKLSKQTGARALDLRQPVQMLSKALAFLNHTPPNEVTESGLDALWQWAFANWSLAQVPKSNQVSPDY